MRSSQGKAAAASRISYIYIYRARERKNSLLLQQQQTPERKKEVAYFASFETRTSSSLLIPVAKTKLKNLGATIKGIQPKVSCMYKYTHTHLLAFHKTLKGGGGTAAADVLCFLLGRKTNG
jgi:hypothetical protein